MGVISMNDAAMGSRDGPGPVRPLAARRPDRTLLERYLFIPIGILWLGLLVLLALPIMVFMTLLYFLTRPFAALQRPRRRGPGRAADRQDPTA